MRSKPLLALRSVPSGAHILIDVEFSHYSRSDELGMTQDLSEAFKALGNAHRLQLVQLLIEQEWNCCEQARPADCRLDPASCNVGELADQLAISPSTVSHHLKELERSGLLERARDGRQVFCRVNREMLDRLRTALETAGRPTA